MVKFILKYHKFYSNPEEIIKNVKSGDIVVSYADWDDLLNSV